MRTTSPGLTAVALALWACVTLAGCSNDRQDRRDGDGQPLTLATEDARIVSVKRRLVPTLDDDAGLHFIRDIGVWGDTVAVVDHNDRITFLDRDLRLLGRWGGSGEGPGEYVRPFVILRLQRGWLIADDGNRRATYLDPGGTVTETRPTPVAFPGRGAAQLGGDLVLPIWSEGHYAVRIDGSGSRPWARRPYPPTPDDPKMPAFGTASSKDFIDQARNEVFVLDGETGDIFRYSEDGSVAQRWTLPPSFAEVALKGTGWSMKDFNGRSTPTYRPAFRTFTIKPDESEALIFLTDRDSGDHPAAAIVKLREGTLVPVHTDLTDEAWKARSSITSVEYLGEDVLIGTLNSALIILDLNVPP